MLEKPDVPDDLLISTVHDAYGIKVSRVEFLPLGADVDTAAYRITTQRDAPLFAKLRRGEVFAPAIMMPHLLANDGARHVIAPLATTHRGYWTRMGEYTLSLFPFVEGVNGFSKDLSERQWHALGKTMRRLHEWETPSGFSAALPFESFDSSWRKLVRRILDRVRQDSFEDEYAAGFVDVVNLRRSTIETIVGRAESLAGEVQRASHACVLCHGDIHAGNVLLTENADLFVIDWDTLTIAPKERDLMFIGAGIGGTWNTEVESMHFYEGYGPVDVDPLAIDYYRYERIVQDIAEFGKQLLFSTEGGDDRAQSLRYFAGMFEPGDAVDAVIKTT